MTDDPLILDLETKGTAPFQFQPKHKDFQVLFAGFLINGKLVQTNDKEKMQQMFKIEEHK